MSDPTLQIRSFRVVFDLERRIHRIDRFRVPLPYGLPLRSLAYAIGGLMIVLAAQALPVVGPMVGLLPAPLRLMLVPVALSVALTRLRLDGRSAHAAASAWVRYRTRPMTVAAFRPLPRPGPVVLGDLTVAAGPDRRGVLHRPRTPAASSGVRARLGRRARRLYADGGIGVAAGDQRPLG
jgi:hypothetical protein